MIPLHVSGFQTGLVLGRGVGGGGEVGSRFPLPLPIGQCPPEKKGPPWSHGCVDIVWPSHWAQRVQGDHLNPHPSTLPHMHPW